MNSNFLKSAEIERYLGGVVYIYNVRGTKQKDIHSINNKAAVYPAVHIYFWCSPRQLIIIYSDTKEKGGFLFCLENSQRKELKCSAS